MTFHLNPASYLSKIKFAFRALKSPNFRIFFYGQAVSLMGTFIQGLALGWLVYRLTNSPFLLGAVSFTGQIPSLILMPFAGVYADRLNRRKVLVITQGISMIVALTLATLYFTHTIQVWQIFVTSILNGIAIAFDAPFRHSFMLEMVGDKDLLQNAIALNSTLVNSARFIGPAIGGVLVAWIGEGFCFLVNGISFLAVIASLLHIRVAKAEKKPHNSSIFKELREGLSYSYNFLPIRYVLSLLVVVGFLGFPFQTFMPVFARDILHGNSQMLGLLTGAVGAGALTGAILLASLKSIKVIPNIILYSSLTFGTSLAAFSLSSYATLSVGLLFFTGFGMIVQLAATNTLLQYIVDDDKRGRILSLYSLSFSGFPPLGSLLLGAVSPSVGIQPTMAVAGGLCAISAILFSRKVSTVKSVVPE
jgi:MFS family permease